MSTIPATPTRAGSARARLAAMLAAPTRIHGVSLDALHRAVGSPAGASPEEWADLARPFIQGISGYRKNLHSRLKGQDGPEYVVRDPIWHASGPTMAAILTTPDASPDIRLGDHLADEEIASAFAMFLDGEGLRRGFTRPGRQARRELAERLAGRPDRARVRQVDPEPVAGPIAEPSAA